MYRELREAMEREGEEKGRGRDAQGRDDTREGKA